MFRETDFLAAIRESPNDLASRLIYADWLMEHGDARGELIRVQCELKVRAEGEPAVAALKMRERELLQAIAPRWIDPLERLGGRDVLLRWGMVEEMRCDVETFVRHATAIARLAPNLRRLQLQNLGNRQLRAWNKLRSLGSVVELDVSSQKLSGERLRLLLAAPCMGEIETLDLRHNALYDEGLEQIGAARLSRLRDLIVAVGRFSSAGFAALCQSPLAEQLQRLDLSHAYLQDGQRALEQLFSSKRLTELRVLALRGVRIDRSTAIVLTASPHFPRLERVEVDMFCLAFQVRDRLAARFGRGLALSHKVARPY